MTWTKEQPTAPGWYWVHTPALYDVKCVQVVEVKGGLAIHLYDGNESLSLYEYWSGPIEEPEKPNG